VPHSGRPRSAGRGRRQNRPDICRARGVTCPSGARAGHGRTADDVLRRGTMSSSTAAPRKRASSAAAGVTLQPDAQEHAQPARKGRSRSRSRNARPRTPGRRHAVSAASGFLAIVAFQLAIALGAPFGAAAWGGAHSGQLPGGLRTASAFGAAFWALAALTVLARGGVRPSLVPIEISRHGTWVLVGVLALGTAVNAASSSAWERFGWAPLNLALALLSLRLARTTVPSSR
ncbi:MAG: hypothetical protein JWM71_2162, partial [Solirubrobacteraceae bacterium]|nr:hypothetical protein [Solirubrobacteraceae bacterium]